MPKQQGFLSRLTIGPRTMRWLFNLWPPFRGAGIKVVRISPEFREVEVELRTRLLNRNFVGTHFGGSLFAMTDPFFMIMMMQRLGRGYVVWDKAASIRFLKPATGTIRAAFQLSDDRVDEARLATAAGDKFEPTFGIDLTNTKGEVVARIEKTLYIRKNAPRATDDSQPKGSNHDLPTLAPGL